MSKDHQHKSISVYFDTLGCAKNSVDSDKMQETLNDNGVYVTDNIHAADCIVVNTCAFIEAATQESIDTILEYKKFYPQKKIICAGCLVSRYKKDLKNSLTEVDKFLSCKEEYNIFETICDLYNINNTAKITQEDKHQKTFSYVKISEGCNNHCAYCTIPKIRGKLISSPYLDIKSDVSKEIDKGAKEIILVAQDCGVWGSDLPDKHNLSWLLNNLTKDFKNTKFRILYVYPKNIDDKLLFTIAKNNNIIEYLDIPMQHANKDILLSMNRTGDANSYLSLIKKIRTLMPNCTIRSTFIVGYPGETESQFDQLKKFIEQAKLDYAGIFEYSKEEGTKASRLKNQIKPAIKNGRYNELRDIADSISLETIDKKINNVYEVLIEGIEDNRVFGRAQFQAPDVDGIVYLKDISEFSKEIYPGKQINVKIVDTELYDLVGVVI